MKKRAYMIVDEGRGQVFVIGANKKDALTILKRFRGFKSGETPLALVSIDAKMVARLVALFLQG